MSPNKQLEALGRLFMRLAIEAQELNDLATQQQLKIDQLESEKEKWLSNSKASKA